MCGMMSVKKVVLEAFSKDSHVCLDMEIISECELKEEQPTKNSMDVVRSTPVLT